MEKPDSLRWRFCHFDQLTTREFYALAKLRVDVFVVEQSCAYAELDGLDVLDDTVHLFAQTDGLTVACARILAPRQSPALAPDSALPAVHIGRVAVAPEYRGQGIASHLMQRALDYCETQFAQHEQALAAQVEVEGLYTALGFRACSETYLEDGIAHVDMRRAVTH